MSTETFDARDDRAAALWADEKQGDGWTPARQAALNAWLAGRPDRQRLLEQHEALIADPAVLWAARRAAHRNTAQVHLIQDWRAEAPKLFLRNTRRRRGCGL